MTVEPGVYFIPALLQDPALRERHRDAVRWDKVDALARLRRHPDRGRLLVTEAAPEVLTRAIP